MGAPITAEVGAKARGVLLSQRKPPVLPATQRQPFRVLQSGHAPAQLSLFLRPGMPPR